MHIDMRPSSVTRRVKAQQRRRTLSAAMRLAAKEAARDETGLEREYSVDAIADGLHVSLKKIGSLLRRGRLPEPDFIRDGRPYWRACTIEPALQRMGYSS